MEYWPPVSLGKKVRIIPKIGVGVDIVHGRINSTEEEALLLSSYFREGHVRKN
jgi:hypothetical protein